MMGNLPLSCREFPSMKFLFHVNSTALPQSSAGIFKCLKSVGPLFGFDDERAVNEQVIPVFRLIQVDKPHG